MSDLKQNLEALRLRDADLRRPRRRWPLVAGALAIVGLAGFLYARATAAIEVEVVRASVRQPAEAGRGRPILTASGYVVARRKAVVSAKIQGRLAELRVEEGSRVTEGEVIARLESRDVAASREQAAANVKVATANLEQAQAELREAEQNLARSRDLASKNFISASALDGAVARFDKARAGVRSAEAAVAVARANLKAAEVAFDQTLIRAPFDGVVLTKNANVGDNITPFSNALDTKGAVVTMADMDTLEVEADVAESSLARIKVGQPCEILLDAVPDHRFPGVVHRIVPTVDRAKATVLVKVKFLERDERVLPDMSAKVAFLEREVPAADRSPVTAVPRAALVQRDGAAAVFVLRDGRAVRTAVTTGRAIGDLVQVTGVTAGEKVVLRPSERLDDGARVKVEQK